MRLGTLVRALVGIGGGLALGPLVAELSHRPERFWVGSALWGLCLLGSFCGWGRIAARLAGVRLDAGERGAWGLALLVMIGGILELLALGHRPVLFALVGVGLAALPRPRKLSLPPWDGVTGFGAALVVTLFALGFFASIHGTVFNGAEHRDFDFHDDYQSYLVFPEKIVQTGAIGSEPWDVRRLLALGGQSWLQALVVAALPIRALHLLEQGLAPLLAAGVLWSLMRRWTVPLRLRWLILASLALAPHTEVRGNTTSLTTTLALLLALAGFLARTADERPATIRAVALLASALVALKTTVIPPLALLLVLTTFAGWRRAERGAIRDAIAAGALGFALTLPWMLAMLRSSGTLLFPLLGAGTYGTRWSADFANSVADASIPLVDRAATAFELLRRTLPVLLLTLAVRDGRARQPALALGVVALAESVLLAFVHDPYILRSLVRYQFPFIVAALTLLAAVAFERGDEAPRIEAGAAFVALALFVFEMRDPIQAQLTQNVRNLADARHARDVAYADAAPELTGLLDAVPAGEPVLTRLRYPFRIDFSRHDARVMGLPGMASAAPGLPLAGTPEELRRALVEQKVHYLAYGGKVDPARLLRLSIRDIEERYAGSRARREMLGMHLAFHERVLALAARATPLTATRDAFLLDLTALPPEPPGEARHFPPSLVPRDIPWRTGLYADGAWTDGHLRLDGLGLEVEPAASQLVIELEPWSPVPVASLDPRAQWNGIELRRLAVTNERLSFRMPSPCPRLARFDLTSATFVPADHGDSPDHRQLGLAIRAIRVTPEEPKTEPHAAPG